MTRSTLEEDFMPAGPDYMVGIAGRCNYQSRRKLVLLYEVLSDGSSFYFSSVCLDCWLKGNFCVNGNHVFF